MHLMITINNLGMVYGSRVLFDEVDLVLGGQKRYGLVGANGTGKSTFLRVIAGSEEPSGGTITFQKQVRIGWLRQDQFRYEDEVVLNVVLQGKKNLWQALQERDHILKCGAITAQQGYRLADLEDIIAENDGYVAESVAQCILSGLGIAEGQQYDFLRTLSGGYKLRVLLAQALFDNPDVLILDEPNNYLDLSSIIWLENYLKNTFKGLLIFTSHDQDFLNNVATHILDIDYGEIREYVGNYNVFLKQKTLVVEQKLHQRAHMEKKIAKLRVFIERFRASPSRSTQALSREKMIEKMELPDIEKSSRRAPKFGFSLQRQSGNQVLRINNIDKSFGAKVVLKKVGFVVNRGEKIAIIGQNGIGKSTLLNIVMGLLPADKGTYEWGHEAHVSYFAQEHNEMAHDATTVYDWLSNHTQDIPSSVLRQTLGTHLFEQSDVFKKVSCLSGGEITRLLCAKIQLEKRNVLLFDEPTNHLDLESRSALADALNKYTGTLMVVSHDRHFVAQIANRIIAITRDGVIDFLGTYGAYAAKEADYLRRK